MMRNHFDQDLRCWPDRLPLLLRLIDQRRGLSVQALRLLDERLSSIEKIVQRLGRGQGFLKLFEVCGAEAGNGADEVNEPMFQHCLTSLVPGQYTTGAQTYCRAKVSKRLPISVTGKNGTCHKPSH